MILEFLSFPFMQRALLVGAVLGFMLGWLGVYVLSKRMSFVGDGVAHASLAFVAIGVLTGIMPLGLALVGSIILGTIIHLLERHSRIQTDAAIGVVFTTGMALGIVLLRFADGFVPELVSFLFGNILSIQTTDVWVILAACLIMFVLLSVYQRQLLFIITDPIGARLSGIKEYRLSWLLTVMISISVVLSIKLIGIILVSALLIIPASIAKRWTTSFTSFQTLSAIVGALVVIAGLLFSVVLDIPSGATIVLTASSLFFLSLLRRAQ